MNEPLTPDGHAAPDQRPATPEPRPASPAIKPKDAAELEMRRMSRRSFLRGGAAVAAGWLGWKWLVTRRDDDGVPWPLRQGLRTNEDLARDLAGPSRQLPTYPAALAEDLRPNGDDGLSDDFDPSAWKLHVVSENAPTDDDPNPAPTTDMVTLADIKALPKVDLTAEHKCIEGWSQVVHWTGVRFADFVARFGPTDGSIRAADLVRHLADLPEYVSLMTPDGGYYVGLDMAGALHPQTLLCYAMNGKPLTLEHGAPLRLVMPTRYGVKSIKRIGTIRFTSRRPGDFWAEQGYDWYCGF